MIRTIRMTDKQIATLEWDRKAPARAGRGWREFDLTEEEYWNARDIADALSWGSDCVTSAKALMRKLEQAE